VDLADKAKVRLDKLSGGQQQKVQLGVTIMGEPELLILDEPTKGFDPVNRRLLLSIIEERRQAGATVLMVTHQMDEVERLCDRVLLLKNGVAEAYGTISEIQAHYGGTTARVTFTGDIPSSPRYRVIQRENNYAELDLDEGVDEADVLRELVQAGVSVRSFVTGRPSMDDIFMRVYGGHDESDEV
jgi:ABC-2 type transport system ATP-binding protein